jgi:hypothetical protein
MKTCDVLLLKGTLEAMRTRMDLLIAKFMMLRSEDRRRVELPDLFYIPMKNEGVMGDVNLLCLQLCQGKVCLCMFRIELIKIYRQTRMVGYNMVLHFVIRMSWFVP